MQFDKKKMGRRLIAFVVFGVIHNILMSYAWTILDMDPATRPEHLFHVSRIVWPILSFPIVGLIGETHLDTFVLQFILNSCIWAGAILAALIYTAKKLGREF